MGVILNCGGESLYITVLNWSNFKMYVLFLTFQIIGQMYPNLFRFIDERLEIFERIDDFESTTNFKSITNFENITDTDSNTDAKKCRDATKCFINGQRIMHKTNGHEWIGIYNSNNNSIIHNEI